MAPIYAHQAKGPAARRALVLRAPPNSMTMWPGEFVEVQLSSDAPPDSEYALEPRTDSPCARRLQASQLWPPPSIVSSVAGKIRIPNLSSEPLSLKRNEHFCQVNPVFVPDSVISPENTVTGPPPAPPLSAINASHSSSVRIDPDNLLPTDVRASFSSLLKEYDDVFDPSIKGYNGAVGHFEARVNMGPVEPPQCKGRLPQYACDRLVELQQKFDQLEDTGVFKEGLDGAY